MRCWLAIWLICLLPLVAGADSIRVATYNLRNYLIMDRNLDGVYRPEYPKPEAEKKALRACILSARPDVLAVQEIGGAAFLEELRRDLKDEGLEYPHSALFQGADEARMLAVLSRIPFVEAGGQKAMDFTYYGERVYVRRGLQEVRFETDGQAWVLFNLHLTSRWTEREDDPESEHRRTGEARTIRNYIRENYPPQTRYLLVGDFNSPMNSRPLRRFMEVNEKILAEPLPATDTRGEYWTYFWQREYSYQRVDFILASPPMLGHVRSHGIVDIPEALQGSDHRLVYADLAF